MKTNGTSKPTPRWLFPLIIIVAVFSIYGNSIKNGFSLDDDMVTAMPGNHNQQIEKGFAGIPDIFTSRYYNSNQQNYGYRPLPLVTFAIEYQFFKGNPHISHFINLLIYTVICVLLFFILSYLFSAYHKILPILITLLFIVHPIHTEVVDSLKNRDELMVFLFGLCSLHFALRYFDNKKIYFIFISFLFLLLGFFSKETAILFLPLIPVTIYFFKPVNISKFLISILIVLLVYVAYTMIRRHLLHGAPHPNRVFVFTENPLFYIHNIFRRFFPALFILLFYLKILLIPYPLSCYYGYDTIPVVGWHNPLVWVSLIIYLGLTIFALINLPKKSILSFGILFYLIAIAPFANFLRPAAGILAERFAFTASLGFCITVALVLLKVFKIPFQANTIIRKFKIQFIAVVIVILGTYSFLAISRNNDWKDILTLCRKDVKHFDKSYNLHYLIAGALNQKIKVAQPGPVRDNMIQEFLEHQRKIAELVNKDIAKYPTDYMSRNNLGTIYVNYLKDPATARRYFRQAISIKPDYIEAYYNLAFSYQRSEITDSAIFYYNKTLEKNSSYNQAYSRLNEIYINKGDLKKALVNDEASIKISPNNAEFYVNSGNVCMLLKDTLKGISFFEKAVEVEPNNSVLRSQIVNFLMKTGHTDKAEQLELK